MSSTRVSRRVNAPRAAVYQALLDPRAVATWMVPDGMTSHVHAFDAREGGAFRISSMTALTLPWRILKSRGFTLAACTCTSRGHLGVNEGGVHGQELRALRL